MINPSCYLRLVSTETKDPREVSTYIIILLTKTS